MSKLHVMKSDVDFDEEPMNEQGKEQRPAWMATLQSQCEAHYESLKVTDALSASMGKI
jgi:hypothetical protein